MKTHSCKIDLGKRSYHVHIGTGILERSADFIPSGLEPSSIFIITDSNVANKYAGPVRASLGRAGNIPVETFVVPAGEAGKNWEQAGIIVDWLVENKIARDSLVVALGGGVIGDLAGFAAASVLRGVNFIQIPTTLLAQVDSSVGGKTGVNTKHGKNTAGAFHQPVAVIADVKTLETLPRREILAGYAEIVKAGLISPNKKEMKQAGLKAKGGFFNWLELNGEKLCALEAEIVIPAIAASVYYKGGVVKRDEFEKGERKLLNLGHTFGHALEAAAGYSADLLHGEAVAIGICMALDLSSRMGICSPSDYERVAAHFKKTGLRTHAGQVAALRQADADGLLEIMRRDKKVSGGRMNFIVSHGIGDARINANVPENLVRDVLQESLKIG